MTSPGRRGRRPGAPDTRAAILHAARAAFAGAGFAGATIRGIASKAGVDAALVHHYFGSKADLFLAALSLPVDPRKVLAPVVAGGPERAGRGLVAAMLSVWDNPAVRPSLLAMVRSALDGSAPNLVTEGFLPAVIRPVLERLGVDRVEERLSLVASQVAGLVVVRYVAELEPIASMPAEDVVERIGPTIQRYLTGPLP